MGGSSWSDDYHSSKSSLRAASGYAGVTTPYSAAVASGTAVGIHADLDPKGIKTIPSGKRARESRDSDTHPCSNAIAVFLDETGSMAGVTPILTANLKPLMSLLLKKGYVSDPQILFGAFGDAANNEQAPIQVGQFESGGEMDDVLDKIYLEGNGGGGGRESAELAMFIGARYTSIDCYEKRATKGYFFIVTDEMPYPAINKNEVKTYIGDTIQDNIPITEVLKELQEMYNVYVIMPKHGAQNSGNKAYRDAWVKLLGQNVIDLEDNSAIAETIALTIGLNEGVIDHDDALNDLKDVGTSSSVASAATKAIAHINKGGGKIVNIGNLPVSDDTDVGTL